MEGDGPRIVTPGADVSPKGHARSDQGGGTDGFEPVVASEDPPQGSSPILPPPPVSTGARPRDLPPLSPSLEESTMTPILEGDLVMREGKGGHHTSWHGLLICIFNSLATLLLLLCCLLIVAGSRLAELADPLGVDEQFRVLPAVMIQGAVILMFFLIWGIIAYLLDSALMGGIFIFGLLLLYITQAFYTWELNINLRIRVASLTQHWGELTPSAKNAIQAVGRCCGYWDPEDRPGNFCPALAYGGCKQRLHEIVLGIRRAMGDAMIVSFLTFLLLGILIYFITIYRTPPEQRGPPPASSQ